MKYVVFIIGLLLSLLGFGMFFAVWVSMTIAPEPGYSSLDYVGMMALFGGLPLVFGTILCFFAVKKWLKTKNHKVNFLNTESDNEKSVDPATVAANRRSKRFIIWCTSFYMVLGTIGIVLLLNWLGFNWRGYWPLAFISLLAFLFGTFIGVRKGHEIVMRNREGKR